MQKHTGLIEYRKNGMTRHTTPTTSITRRCAMAGMFGGVVLASSPIVARTLPVATSLPDELARAIQRGSPLLVMVSLDGCPFCKIARENYLLPLQGSQGLAMVQVEMRGRQMVQGFTGAAQTHEALSRSWSIKVAPTVLFFGRNGVEVAQRLEGGYLPDFYGAYLDDRVQLARASIMQSKG
jgi:hypothetical protein